MITIERTTDLSKLLKPEPLTGQIFNNESGGHRFIISCTRNGVYEPLTGSVTGRFLRPDGVGVQITSSYASIDGMGRAVVTLPSNCYIKTGAFTLVITHVDSSSNRTNIYAGAGYVRVGETDTIVDPENIINVDAIQALIDDMIDATGDAEAAAEFVPDIIAVEFAAATAYAAGTYVTYDNKLYRITADHAANTTWANTSKVLVTVGKELADLKSAINEHGVNITPDTIAGKYVKPSDGVDSLGSNYTIYVYPVYGLTSITVIPYVTNQYMGYCFKDKSKATLGNNYGAYSSTGENVLSVPSGAYYVYITSNNVSTTAKAIAKWCDLLEDKIDADTIKEKVSELEQNSTIDSPKTIAYSDMDTSQTGIIETNGSIATYANCYLSDYVSCIPGTEISYLIAYIYGNYVAVAFYDENKAHINGSDIKASSGTSGSFTKVEGTSTIPANAKYFRFTVSKNTAASVTAGDQFVTYTNRQPIKEIVEDVINNGSSSQWNNKRWCAFGTSITDTSYINQETGEVSGKYVPFLAQYSGLSVTNRGIAGGTIGSGGIHGGSSNILNAILNSNDLDTFDIITLEGFVNDFAAAVSIGQIGDTSNTTMYGALHQAISYILAHSHAEVILITETTGQEYTLSGGTTVSYKILRKNSLDLYQQDYNDVIIRIGQFYGVHVIDAGGKSQINQYHPEYIIDQIHHTTLGGEQYAKTVWEELKNIMPAKVAEENEGT